MKSKGQKIRLAIQIFFFSLIALIAANHTLAERGIQIPFLSTASIHAICPFGGVETFYQLVTTGGYIQKIHASSVVLMSLVFFLAILFGPVFCGFVCPLGSVQEWFAALGKKIFPRKKNPIIPQKVDKVLRFFRYGVLALVLYNTFKSGLLLFSNVDPYYALFHFWSGEVAVSALVILGITLILGLFVERPWCKYACPYGALLGIFNLFRIFKIRRNHPTCIQCKKCDKSCPMNIEVSKSEVIKNHQCISCMRCTSESNCPIPETVVFGTQKEGKQKPYLKTGAIGVIVLVVIFGGIAVTSLLGYWNTENEKKPNRLQGVSSEGAYNPEEIRGSYTLEEVVRLYDIPEDVLRTAFSLPMEWDLTQRKSKDLEALYGNMNVEIGNGSLQVFVALYKGLPIYLGEDFLPQAAVSIIQENNPNLTEEQRDYLDSHAVEITELSPWIVLEEEEEEETGINGNTTIQSLLDLGITEEEIKEVLGEIPKTNLNLRSYCQENGISFSQVKDRFLELVNR